MPNLGAPVDSGKHNVGRMPQTPVLEALGFVTKTSYLGGWFRVFLVRVWFAWVVQDCRTRLAFAVGVSLLVEIGSSFMSYTFY